MLLKQCKRAIWVVRFLRKAGIEETLAWRLALSGKGWWRLSSIPAGSMVMNKEWFSGMGYQSQRSIMNK